MSSIGVIADDLTGAMDTGAQFARVGLTTLLALGEGQLPSAEVIVISTDTRAEQAPVAYERVRLAAQRLRNRAVYKKMDSTLRGNVGAELDGALDGLGLRRALVAPAFPSAGRTIANGHLCVFGVPLSETSFAGDPLWPATESHVPTLLARQTCRSIGHLPLSVVERGEREVLRAIESATATIVVADAVDANHLRTLTGALIRCSERWLPCGSAGLATEWAASLGPRNVGQAPFRWPRDPRPVLVIAGSRHAATMRQLLKAEAEGLLELVKLPADDLVSSEVNESWEPAIESRAVALLSQGRSVGLTTSFSPYREGSELTVAQELAQAGAKVLARSGVAGVMATGGDIARTLCQVLEVRALRIEGEVQYGVPAGTLIGGPRGNSRMVTKAGAFGDDLTIVQSIHFLQGGSE